MDQSDFPSAFSFPHLPAWSAYLPRLDLGFGLALCPGFPLRASISTYLVVPPGTDGISQVLNASLLTCQALVTPAGPRDSHHAEP